MSSFVNNLLKFEIAWQFLVQNDFIIAFYLKEKSLLLEHY